MTLLRINTSSEGLSSDHLTFLRKAPAPMASEELLEAIGAKSIWIKCERNPSRADYLNNPILKGARAVLHIHIHLYHQRT